MEESTNNVTVNNNDEVIKLLKKQVMYARAGFAVGIITALCCVSVAFLMYKNVTKVVEPVINLSEELSVAVGNLQEISDTIIKDDVVGQLNDGVARLTEIDIDTLNQGISDFSAAVEPLGNFAKRFSR